MPIMGKSTGNASNQNDIWELLKASPVLQPAVSQVPTKPKTEAEKKKEKRELRQFFLIADLISAIAWAYLLASIFLFNFGNGLSRSLIIFSILLVISFTVWRWYTLLTFLYIFFFPLTLLFWKIPKLIYHRRSWLLAFVFLNMIATTVKNLRYNLKSKTSGIIASLFVFGFHNKYLAIIGGAWLFCLLCWATIRAFAKTIKSNWFLNAQESTINRIVNSKWRKGLSDVDKKILSGKVKSLTTEQANAVTNALTARMVVNRGLLLWAYGLQRYKQARLTVLFNGLAYLLMFMGALYSFWIINIVTLTYFPSQFVFSVHPSNISALLYTLDSFFFSDGSQIIAKGDFAELVRIISGIFVWLVLGYFVITIFRSVAIRDDKSIEELVSRLRATADREEELLKQQFRVGVAEAAHKLAEIGKGFSWLLTMIISAVPSDFLDSPEKKSNK